MKNRIQFDALFARCPDLCGFSIEAKASDLGNVTDQADLVVTAVGISPRLSAEQYGEIFEQISASLAELIDEDPDSAGWLAGRTFARTIH
jgi:hypothetical protein